jgi:hypothetical protein
LTFPFVEKLSFWVLFEAVRLYVCTGVPFFLMYAFTVLTERLEARVVAAVFLAAVIVFLACRGAVDPTALPTISTSENSKA